MITDSLLKTALALGAALVPALATAQYPAKPIHLIVPFSAGGPSDNAARAIGQALSASMGQQVVVENRPGASGAIAAKGVLGAPADGHTLLWGVASMVSLPLLQKAPPFQSLAELTPVSIVGRFTFAMYLHPGVPAKSVSELVSYARANPGRLSYASSTMSEYMAATQFMKAAAIDMLRVPYKGGAQALPDLLEGRVQVNFGPLSMGLPHVKESRLRMLATLLAQRSPVTPEVPTMAEAGMPFVSIPTWQAIFAPPKTPQEVAQRVANEVAIALRNPELRARFEGQGMSVEGSTPAALAGAIEEDLRAWALFVRENGITPE